MAIWTATKLTSNRPASGPDVKTQSHRRPEEVEGRLKTTLTRAAPPA